MPFLKGSGPPLEVLELPVQRAICLAAAAATDAAARCLPSTAATQGTLDPETVEVPDHEPLERGSPQGSYGPRRG